MNRIVVGVDGSANGRRALEWALREATVRDAKVIALHVHRWDPPPEAVKLRFGDNLRLPEEEQRSAEMLLDAEIAAAGDLGAGVPVDRVVLVGVAPASALVDASKDADMLVLGSRGLGGFTGLLLGSVSQQCSHHAHCPVVIVPPEE